MLFLKKKHVRLFEWVSREESLMILSKSLAYLSVSRYEGLSFANLEALALGIPILASEVPGNRETVLNGETGFVFKENDIDDFVDKLHQISTNSSIRNQFRSNSIQFFDSNYNIINTVNSLESIYDKVIRKK